MSREGLRGDITILQYCSDLMGFAQMSCFPGSLCYNTSTEVLSEPRSVLDKGIFNRGSEEINSSIMH